MKRLYALSIACLLAMTASVSAEALNWMGFAELDRANRSYVKLDEDERVRDVRVARARLKQSPPQGQTDALFVFHESSIWCGTADCLLEVFVQASDGSMEKVLDLNVHDVSLGRAYTKGMRNLRFDGAVTWVWTGRTFDLK